MKTPEMPPVRRDIMAGRGPYPGWYRRDQVRWTHKPTEAEGHSDCHRSLWKNDRAARRLCEVRAVACLAGMPEPSEIGVVRSYVLDGRWTGGPHIEDHRAGRRVVEGAEAVAKVLDGEIDGLLRAARNESNYAP